MICQCGSMRRVTAVHDLLLEVNALAHQLRKADFQLQQNEGLLAAGRGVLQVLAEQGPRTVPWIAVKQNSSRQNVQIIANRFASAGLVSFSKNPAHKKSDLLEITEKGRQILSASKNRERRILEALPLASDEARVRSAAELLRQIRDDLKAVQENCPGQAINWNGPRRSSARPEKKIQPSPPVRSEQDDESTLPVSLL